MQLLEHAGQVRTTRIFEKRHCCRRGRLLLRGPGEAVLAWPWLGRPGWLGRAVAASAKSFDSMLGKLGPDIMRWLKSPCVSTKFSTRLTLTLRHIGCTLVLTAATAAGASLA